MNLVRGLLSREIRYLSGRNICLSRCKFETYYEVLQLPRSCSQKDIKTAFIKLSKQYHPDINADDSTHMKFVKLNEAYSVLSRPETRKTYDRGLVSPHIHQPFRRARNVHYDTDFTTDEQERPFRDFSFWENRDRSKDAENLKKPYYGIRGIKKVSNLWILSFVILFGIIGVSLQVMLIRKSVAFSRQSIEEESARNAQILLQLRKKVMEEGSREEMLARLRKVSDEHDALRKAAKREE